MWSGDTGSQKHFCNPVFHKLVYARPIVEGDLHPILQIPKYWGAVPLSTFDYRAETYYK